MKQGELAERLRKSQTAVSHWESGKRSPSLEDLVAVAQVLEQPLISLLPDERPVQPSRVLMRAVLDPLDAPEINASLERFVAKAELLPPLPVKVEVAADRPVRAAQQLLSRAQISGRPPIDIAKLAFLCGVHVVEAPLDDFVSGLLIDLEGVSVVGVNAAQHPNRQRFTIAHELGHHLLRHHDRFHIDLGTPSGDGDPPFSDPRLEREANDFAANVLMPASLLRDESQLNPAVEPLAERFRVSPLAMGYRLVALGLR